MSLRSSVERWKAAFERVAPELLGRALSQPEMHVALAVALYETGLGRGWVSRKIYDNLRAWGWCSDPFDAWADVVRSSTNLGATQHKRPSDFGEAPWPARSPDGKAFLYYDTSPRPGGPVPYPMYFRARFGGSDEEIARDYLRILFVIYNRQKVLDAAAGGDLYQVSQQLRYTSYYEGFGETEVERINNHHRALTRAAVSVGRALAWPLPDGTALPPRTLQNGSQGEDVAYLQALLGLQEDGIFGPNTEAAVVKFQKTHGLAPDGVVGELTWTALEANAQEEETKPETPDSVIKIPRRDYDVLKEHFKNLTTKLKELSPLANAANNSIERVFRNAS